MGKSLARTAFNPAIESVLSKRRNAMKRMSPLNCLIALTLISGCYDLRDDFGEFRIGMANRFAADSAWRNMEGVCAGMNCPHSVREGFRSGYSAVANGGNGCPPAFPVISCHNHMWLDRCSEKEKMEAWYDGYELGAMAAKADGMADANRIVTRLPQSTPIDYSGVNTPRPAAVPESTGVGLPPTPASDTPAPEGSIPQQPAAEEPQSSF